MGKVVSIEGWAEHGAQYEVVRKRAVSDIEYMVERFRDAATELAFEGPWKEWSDEAEVGTVVEVTPEALMETGDAKVRALVLMVDAMEDALAVLRELAGKG